MPSLAARGGRRHYRPYPAAEAEAELAAAEKIGARLMVLTEPDYPSLLRQIEPPPPVLYLKGAIAKLQMPGIAIVGSRNASALGQSFAKTLALELGQAGLLVISGLARGIDTAAHWGALGTGTAAVLAGGIDIIYPPENRGLYERISEEGILISEMPIGFQPRGQDFPRRNRLISGMSLGVIVVEGAEASGSLITARFALEQNREVFAVPGHPLDPRASGPNRLIKSGATLLTEAGDALAVLTPLMNINHGTGFREPGARETDSPEIIPFTGNQFEITDSQRGSILAALSPVPVSMNALVEATGVSPRVASIIVLELELAGLAERHPGGLVSVKFAG